VLTCSARVDSKGNIWIYFDSLGVRLKVTPSYFRRHSERLISDRDEVLKKLNLDKQDGA